MSQRFVQMDPDTRWHLRKGRAASRTILVVAKIYFLQAGVLAHGVS